MWVLEAMFFSIEGSGVGFVRFVVFTTFIERKARSMNIKL